MGTIRTSERRTRNRFALALVPVSLLVLAPLHAATPIRFAGAVSGLVMDSAGKPKPGAAVALYNQQERLLQKTYTDLAGNFSFGDLLPDFYAVQVSLASFVPTSRDRVQVRSGMRSLLEVSLSKIFSSIQVVSTTPAPGSLMSDDWKWTLRADSSQRPILRILPAAPGAKSAGTSSSATTSGTARTTTAGNSKTAIFHDSTGLVKISATDSALTDAAADEADLGTQFAFATSVFSTSQVQVSGNLGYASGNGLPATAIRTTFSHQVAGDVPSVSVMMREMNAPVRVSQGLLGGPAGEGSLPTLRTLSISMADKIQLSDALSVVYGSQLDTITFLNRLQYFSPWAKLSYVLPRGHLDMVFTSGNAQPGLDSREQGDGLQNELSALSLIPHLTQRDGQIKVQRGDDYEIGYSEVVGAMEYRVSGYHQYVSNATLTIASPDAGLFTGDLLPSMFTSSGLFDAGSISSVGYTVSATRSLGQHHKLTVAYGTLGVLTPDNERLPISNAGDLRQAMMAENRQAVTLRSAGLIRHTGTHYVASYQYADLKSSVAVASFSTQPDRAEPGFNIAIRQPLPFFGGMPGHIEATAEMRNVLAQGYLPLGLADGRQILVVNNPRVFRGGLAFIF